MNSNRGGGANEPYNYSEDYQNGGVTRGQPAAPNTETRIGYLFRDIVFLGLGGILGSVAALFAAASVALLIEGNLLAAFVGAFPTALFAKLSYNIFRSRSRLKRAAEYKNFLSGWAGCTLKELSAVTGRSVSYLEKDLFKLIRKGYMNGAWLDREDKVLFASEANYRDYVAERRARKLKSKPDPRENTFSGRVNSFLRQVQEIKPEMDDLTARGKVERMEGIITEIRDWVADHPDSEDKVKRLSNYYLPTTLKLLRTYISVDNNPGSTAQDICKNITEILGTFNVALRNMQDSLLDHTALDVSAEIGALEAMLQQEGLAGDEISMVALRGGDDLSADI